MPATAWVAAVAAAAVVAGAAAQQLDDYVTAAPPPPSEACAWSSWGEWSDCSRSCGQGTRTRYRTKTTFEYLDGTCTESIEDCTDYSLIRAAGGVCTSRDVEPCNGGDAVAAEYPEYTGEDDDMTPRYPYGAYGPCESNSNEDGCVGYRPCPIDCVWTAWSSWSECSATCGQNGVQYRTRSVAVQPEPAYFFNSSSTGYFDSFACELNTLNQTYTGDHDSEAGGYPCGEVCTGDDVEWRSCFRKECPVDCEWSEWSSWSSCSKLCGGGSQTRTRYVKQQPQHGGGLCVPGECDDGSTGTGSEKRCGASHTRKCNPESCEYARLHSKQDDYSKDQDLCQWEEEGSVHCPANLTRDGGHLTAVGGDTRPNDEVTSNCLEGSGDPPGYECETW